VNEVVSSQQDLLSQVTGLFSRTLNAITNFVLILFIGLYLAVTPDLYVGGLVGLVPVGRRSRARQVIQAAGHTLRWWLVGRIFSMIVIGVLSVLGLWLIGVPLALVLGLLAGLLGFIPILGPILALVPPLLLALSNSPQQALYVVLLYGGIQIVESYFLTPMVQQRAVSLPPVLTISSQLILGLLFGFMGIAMAPPLAAMGMVLVQMLYVEDTLGDQLVDVMGESDD
jgi:predicted PurR-regulated permease PerM